MRRIIIEGNQCYEIDEECMRKKRQRTGINTGSPEDIRRRNRNGAKKE